VDRSPSRPELVATGLAVHLALWALVAALVAFIGRASLFPGRPWLRALAVALPLALAVALLATRGSRSVALRVVGVLSLLALVIVLAETVRAVVRTDEVSVARFPYPYRMHGTAPGLEPATNHLHIATNDSGLRDAGPIPPKPTGERRVVVLGGSAVLGVGSPEEHTAPRLLQERLAARLAERPVAGVETVRVINAGQGYYNSTQELVFLVTELALYEPDLVVVADGYNDLHHALVWGSRPPANEVATAMIERLLHGGGTVRQIGWPDAAYAALQASYLANRTRGGLAGRLLAPSAFGLPVASPRGPKADARFLPLVRHRLVMNWTLIDRLTRAFGARALFALQPTVFVKEPLAPEERRYVDGLDVAPLVREGWLDLERFVRGEAARLGLATFEADRLVRVHPERLFTDYCHLLPEGNRLWAEAMAERVDEELRAGPLAARWDGVRFPFDEGDPRWRPAHLGPLGAWR
jgi:lysophospholipase L1-like esterase